ncbi:MAG: TIGR03435 family protein [Bryobacteraceae bacterium]
MTRAFTLGAALLLGGVTCAQSFEAASIKPVKPSARQRRPGLEGGPGTSDPGRIRYSNISLHDLILLAYRVRGFQLSASDTKALDAKTFEVAASLPPGATRAQMRGMLQNLLTERFHLATHREQKVMSVYALVVGKNGPKLKEAVDQPGNGDDDFDPLPPAPPNELEVHDDGYPNVPPREGSWLVALRSGYARTHQLHASMADLAGILSNQLEKPVTDATGLKGRYEFTLSWMVAVPASSAPSAPAADTGPDLFAAVQQQLGLKLEASKAPVDVLVIDHFDRDPVEN